MAAQAVVQPFLDLFKEFPPRQKAASFTLDQALAKMAESFEQRTLNSGRRVAPTIAIRIYPGCGLAAR